jgi:hypothetical protein
MTHHTPHTPQSPPPPPRRGALLMTAALSTLAITLGACTSDAPPTLRPIDLGVEDSFVPPLQRFDAYMPPSVGDAYVLRGFGEPCEEGTECESGYCIDTPRDGRVCTKTCAGQCPSGFDCVSIGTAPDVVLLCAPDGNDLCRSCDTDDACDDPDDLCIQVGQRTYCGEACAEDLDCPEGFSCEDVAHPLHPEGVRQCVPASGECAPCMDADEDGYGVGEDCLGFDCNDADPLSFSGAGERCDGRDNDCDSLVDESLTDAPPADLTCAQEGVCEGATAACLRGAWACTYPDASYEADESRCDTLDNDCDGRIDEAFDLTSDPARCGACENRCEIDRATPRCVSSQCAIEACDPGWVDLDGRVDTGCEYACAPTLEGVEACDTLDNDCDGLTDEGFDLAADALNCGACGRVCAFSEALPRCVEGDCEIAACRPGFYNVNGDLGDGCEYACLPSGVERCDLSDNDCDGVVDEGFNLSADLAHCGGCGVVCALPQSNVACVEGSCGFVSCREGFYNINGDPADGCEYACAASNGGVEACDAIDNDCDGRADEGFDVTSDVLNCGRCGRACDLDNATASCELSTCVVGSCDEGWVDLDARDTNGCEYSCAVTLDGVEACDLSDNDCDGATDEGFAFASDNLNCGSCGRVCAFPNAGGLCVNGDCALMACVPGFYNTNADPADGCEYGCNATGAERCDVQDNDCDGLLDEGFDLSADLNHCGACNARCQLPNASVACVAGDCTFVGCSPNFYDLNRNPNDGCEYGCSLTNGAVERCDRIDNDCDGRSDETFNLQTDLNNCGTCGNICSLPNAVTTCAAGDCAFVSCRPGFVDLDGNTANGCEYACTPTAGVDLPDLNKTDSDCDGIDGDRSAAVFLSPQGSDSANGLTPAAAVSSLSRALLAATLNARSQVWVVSGTYTQSASVGLVNGVGIYGGYTTSFLSRDNTRATFSSTAATALEARNLTLPTTLQQIDLITSDRAGAGQATMTLIVQNSGAHLKLERVQITAGRGGSGAAGGAGTTGLAGSNGADASGSGGGGGGSLGGGGGAGGRAQSDGLAGSPGASNGSACGGLGGAGSGTSGLGCADGNPRAGGNGGSGCAGAQGSQGAGGGASGLWSGITWSPSGGGGGGVGGSGGGGGGGGAGGGEDCTSNRAC